MFGPSHYVPILRWKQAERYALRYFQTGMRPEEVFRVEVRNVDLSRRTIFNPFGKTKAAKRTIPMTSEVCEILCRRSNETRGRWVFCSPARPGQLEQPDRPIRSVRKAHDAAVRRAGIQQRFRLYDLRHYSDLLAIPGGTEMGPPIHVTT